MVLEEDHLHSNFTSVRAKTVSGGCCCFLLNSLKNKQSLSSRPKILISIMLSLTQSLTALEESSFFPSLALFCERQAHTDGGCAACVFAVDMQDKFIPMDGKNSQMLLRTTLKFRTQVYA